MKNVNLKEKIMKVFKNILFLVVLFYVEFVNAQDDCNKSVLFPRFNEILPKEVCIPNEYVISFLDFEDLNEDDKKDCIISYWKKNEFRKDGDTTFYRIYLQMPDSTFVLKKTLSNLEPLYFKSYSDDYEVKDSMLRELHFYYSYGGGEFDLTFKKNQIILLFDVAAMTGVKVMFQWSSEKEDWLLIQEQNYLGNRCVVQKYYEPKVLKGKRSIDEFNMLDYLK